MVRAVMPGLPRQAMRLVNALLDVHSDLAPPRLAARLRALSERWRHEGWSLDLRAVALILADLLEQGWGVVPVGRAIELRPPGMRQDGEARDVARDRLRAGLGVHRARQLAEPATVSFLRRMHRPVARVGGRRTSIADLIDDGEALAAALRQCQLLSSEAAAARFAEMIRPVVQVCDDEARCHHTGLRLVDVWRYFRHTWSNEYRSIPGRTMLLLVRNAARPNWPVMGIAMLASPVVRLRSRDEWMGWIPEAFFARLAIRSSGWEPKPAIDALRRQIDLSLQAIRVDDLGLMAKDLAEPTLQTVLRMEARAAGAAMRQRRVHEERYQAMQEAGEEIRSQPDPTKSGSAENQDWQQLSEDPLYVHKRADALAKLLAAKRCFAGLDWTGPSDDFLRALRTRPDGERSVASALAEVRKAGLASQVADLSVCGAVAPYNELIGGKLVALLMATEEVKELYRQRYAGKVSIISSQMAGRPVLRPAELKVLTTTSLYGFASIQYNGLRLRADEHPELEQDVRWLELKRTRGWGTYHLAPDTVRTLREVSQRAHGARRVNNRFGEGASPRLRQTRDGLAALGIDARQILHHATPRIFYGCELHPGAIEELVGLREHCPMLGPSVQATTAAWLRRWVVGRVRKTETLERMRRLSAETVKADLLVPNEDGQLALAL
jgi:hypothetical protein